MTVMHANEPDRRIVDVDAYAATVRYHEHVDELRRKERTRGDVSLETLPDVFPADARFEPLPALLSQEEREKLRALGRIVARELARAPEPDQTILRERLLVGRPYAQIVERLPYPMNEAAIRKRYERAVGRVKARVCAAVTNHHRDLAAYFPTLFPSEATSGPADEEAYDNPPVYVID